MAHDPLPDAHGSVTPYLIVADAPAAIAFYKEALGAEELMRAAHPDGKVGHAELRVGDRSIMLADENPAVAAHSPRHYGGSPISLHLYVADADATFAQALAAGAKPIREVADQPYGDRMGGFEDPFGHSWWIATRLKS